MESNHSQLNQNSNTQLLTLQDLKTKTFAILNKTNNDPETEQDFRRTCELFENQKSSQQLKKAYQNYVSAYSKISSLYILYWDFTQKTFLQVFDTENESKKIYKLKIPKLSNLWCTAVLPNKELICFADAKNRGIAFIVNSDFKTRVLYSGESCVRYPSAIYFNRNVYFFGGLNGYCISLSSKYDLDANRWDKLAPVPIDSYDCSSVIFNVSILICGHWSRNLVLYSIDIDSFSIIPYNFQDRAIKLLINAGRLYLIECQRARLIYESEAEDIFSWKQVAKSIIDINRWMHGLYNKGSIYIIPGDDGGVYYKFDLSQNKMFKMTGKK